MALLRGPYGTTQIKGSTGAVTFQSTPGGLVMRARTVPVNPNTMRQQIIRNAMNAAAQAWKITGADPALYALWVNYADNTSWTNRLGDTVRLGPRQQYLRINSFLGGGGEAIIEEPPVLPGIPSPAIVEYSVDTTDGFQALSVAPALADDDLCLFQLAGPLPRTKYFFNGPYPIVRYYNVGDTFPDELVPAGSVAIGNRYFFRTRTYFTGLGLSVALSGFIDAEA